VLLAEQPNKRFATADEIAGTVAFLCGPSGGSITGTTIAVDGGWTAH
jgi:3-hydroxybutyrate dehydrogenase